MRELVLLISCIAILLGCATISPTPVSEGRIYTADYGPYPTDFEEAIKNLMSKTLKDPYSAVYDFGTPRKGYVPTDVSGKGDVAFGYIVPVGINAKNSYGGYTGEKLYYFFLFHGAPADVTNLFKTGLAQYIDEKLLEP